MAPRKKALLVGIGQECVNDVLALRGLLISLKSYAPDDVQVLCDVALDQLPKANPPTVPNIIYGMHWLLDTAEPGDELLVFWSGRTKSFATLITAHVRYMTALRGALLKDVKWVMLMDSCPVSQWPFKWVAAAETTDCVAVTMAAPRDGYDPQAHVVVISGNERADDFVHMVEDGGFYTTFANSIIQALTHADVKAISVLELLLLLKRNMVQKAPEFRPMCGTTSLENLSKPIW